MFYYSTRRQSQAVGFREALIRGQAPDGGLYLPEDIPRLDPDDFESFVSLDYSELAFELSKLWIGDEISEGVLRSVASIYQWEVPVRQVGDVYIVELFHGPTLSFKDFAAQWLGKIVPEVHREKITVLVATSGDTGSAVAAGFFDVPGVEVVLLYPSGGVSELQEKQLTTFGGNIRALEVGGAFDDCQLLVKQAFRDQELRERLGLTSANSINIGRLIPQSFYYIWAYLWLVEVLGSEVVFCVPSGNFGNITGGVLAKRMGIPVSRFIAATNSNHVFQDYLEVGDFEPRASVPTISNAMDVGNPSNMARLLDLYQDNVGAMRKDFWSVSIDDEVTKNTIRSVYEEHGYILDPHTSVGWEAARRFRKEKCAESCDPIAVLSTAHPAKFIDIVESAIGAQKLEIPRALGDVMLKQKKAEMVSADYEEFKMALLS